MLRIQYIIELIYNFIFEGLFLGQIG